MQKNTPTITIAFKDEIYVQALSAVVTEYENQVKKNTLFPKDPLAMIGLVGQKCSDFIRSATDKDFQDSQVKPVHEAVVLAALCIRFVEQWWKQSTRRSVFNDKHEVYAKFQELYDGKPDLYDVSQSIYTLYTGLGFTPDQAYTITIEEMGHLIGRYIAKRAHVDESSMFWKGVRSDNGEAKKTVAELHRENLSDKDFTVPVEAADLSNVVKMARDKVENVTA